MPSFNIHHHHLRYDDDLVRANSAAAEPPPPKPYRRLLPLLLKAIVMVVIISLFFLFMGIAAFAVLHLLIPSGAFRALHRHHHRRRHAAAADSSRVAYSPEDLLRFLPRHKFAAGMAAADCAVCLDSFKEGDWCRSLPDCQHLFHANCVDKWLMKVANCPICRTRVRLNSGATSSEMLEDKFWWAVGV